MNAKKIVERLGSTMTNNEVMGDLVSTIYPAVHRTGLAIPWSNRPCPLLCLYETVARCGRRARCTGIYEEKEEEQWELNTFVDCEVLGWRGIWTSEERRRIGNVDIGRTMYYGLPYYSRWLWAIIRVLMEKQYITLGVGWEGTVGTRASIRPYYSESTWGWAQVDWGRKDRFTESTSQRSCRQGRPSVL